MFSESEHLQALLLDIHTFESEVRKNPEDYSIEQRLQHIADLIRQVDVAVGGFGSVRRSVFRAVPSWLRDPDFGPAARLLRGLDNGDFILIQAACESNSAIREAVQLLRTLQDTSPIQSATALQALDVGPEGREGGIPVITMLNGDPVIVRLHRADRQPGTSGTTLRLDDTGANVAVFADPAPWAQSFQKGVEQGVAAAWSLLQSVDAVGDGPVHHDFVVSGVLRRPRLEGRSAGLAVALDVLATTVRELGQPDIVATGVLSHCDLQWQIDQMDADTITRKRAGVREMFAPRIHVSDDREVSEWLLAPAGGPVLGVRSMPPCAHGSRPHLAAAASCAWGKAWDTWWESACHRRLDQLGFAQHGLREIPRGPQVNGRPAIVKSELQRKILGHFHSADHQADRQSWGTYAIVAGKPGYGRSTAALMAADDLENEGWHVAALRLTRPDGDLPPVQNLIQAASLLLPGTCPNRLIILDDVRNVAGRPGGNDLDAFGEAIIKHGWNLLLVVDGHGHQIDVTGKVEEWESHRAPFYSSGLSEPDQYEILKQLAEQAGGTLSPEYYAAALSGRMSWPTRLARAVQHLEAQGCPIDLPQAPLRLPDVNQSEHRLVCAAVAAVISLGVIPSSKFVAAHALVLAGTSVDVLAHRVSSYDAQHVLDSLRGNLDLSAAHRHALIHYLRWLVDNDDLTGVASVLRRLAAEERIGDLTILLGGQRGADHMEPGRLDWQKLLAAVQRCTEYVQISRLAGACAANAPREIQSSLLKELAVRIRDLVPHQEDPRELAQALRVLRRLQNRIAIEERETYVQAAIGALTPRRLNRSLRSQRRICNRAVLVSELFHWDQLRSEANLVTSLSQDEIFATEMPSNIDELVAARDIVRTLLMTHKIRARSSQTVTIPGKLLDQSLDENWPIDSRLAMLSLQLLCGDTESNPEKLAKIIVQQAPKCHVSQLVNGLNALGSISRPVTRRVMRTALSSGLSPVLAERLCSSPPSVAAEIVYMMLNWDIDGLRRMLYTSGPDGHPPVPNADLLRRLADQIKRYPDPKGVGRLLQALLRTDSEFDPPLHRAAGVLLENLDNELIQGMLETPQMSIAMHLVNGLLTAGHKKIESICDDLLPRVTENLKFPSPRIWSARLALLLIQAEEDGILAPPGGKSVLDILLDDSTPNVIASRIESAPTAAALAVNVRLALRLDARARSQKRPGNQGDTLRNVSQRFDKGPQTCRFCAIDQSSDLDAVLETAQVILHMLRLGGRERPRHVLRTALVEHFEKHRSPLVLARQPGRAAIQLSIMARVQKDLINYVPVRHVAFCVSRALPLVAADLLQAAEKCRPGLAREVAQVVEEGDGWEPLMDDLADPNLEARGRIVASSRLHRLVERPSPGTYLRELIEEVVVTSTSLPMLSAALPLMATWTSLEETVACAKRRRESSRVALDWVPRESLPAIATTASMWQAIGLTSHSTVLMRSAILYGVPQRLALADLSRFLSCAADVLGTVEVQRLARTVSEAPWARRVAIRGSTLDVAKYLVALGWTAYHLQRQGVAFQVDRLTSPRETQPSFQRLWALAWLSGKSAWWRDRWEEAVRDVLATASSLQPGSAAMTLAALSHHGRHIPDDVLPDVVTKACQAPPGPMRALLTILRDREPAQSAPAIQIASLLRGNAEDIKKRLKDPYLRCDLDRRHAVDLLTRMGSARS